MLLKLFSVKAQSGSSIIGPIVGAAVGCIVLLLAILAAYWFYVRPRSLLNKLPADVRWHYEKYFEQPGGYHKHGSGSSRFYMKLVKPDSEVYKSVATMWTGLFASTLTIQVWGKPKKKSEIPSNSGKR